MSVLTDLIPGGGLVDLASKLIDHFIPDATANAAAKAQLVSEQVSGQLQLTLGQLQVNANEAKSTNWFVAGWRPYIGWICGTGLGYQFLLMPLANGALLALGHKPTFIALDVQTLLTCLGGLLGLGSMRTLEKAKGVESNR